MRVAFVCSGKPDNLKYLKNNRDLLDETLSKNGWEVVNTPLSNIFDLNKRLQEYSKNSIDEFLFFYTGHGDVSNRQQILKLQLDNVEISINDILDSIFKYINPKKQAIVLDACYSGTLKDLVLENNTEFLFSSQAREQSYEDDNLKASIFSFYFCEAVINGYVKLEEISEYIDSSDDRQKPLPLNVGSDFIQIAQNNLKLKSLPKKNAIKTFFNKLLLNDFIKNLRFFFWVLLFSMLIYFFSLNTWQSVDIHGSNNTIKQEINRDNNTKKLCKKGIFNYKTSIDELEIELSKSNFKEVKEVIMNDLEIQKKQLVIYEKNELMENMGVYFILFSK